MQKQRVYAFDSQQLTMFQTCPQSYYFSHLRHLETRTYRKGIGKGKVLHKAYEFFYNARIEGKDQAACVKAGMLGLQMEAVKEKLPLDDLQLCMLKFASYCTYHMNDLYYPLKTELGFSLVLYEDPEVMILYEGRIDLIARLLHNNQVIWVDHKNYLIKSSKPEFYTNQFLGYTWAIWQAFGKDAALQGILDNTWMAPSLAPKDSHEMFMGNYLVGQLRNWEKQAIKSTIEMTKLYDATTEEVSYSSKTYNFDLQRHSSCNMSKFGPCQFLPICHSDTEKAAMYQIKTKFKEKDEIWKAW